MTQNIPLVDLKAQYLPLKADIRSAWEQALDSMYLFLGPNVQAFEQEFADFLGVSHAIGVSDGTSALHLALRVAGVKQGDEVITVSHTFIATGEAILLCGAVPVFVDIDSQTYLMDVNQIEDKITPRTRAILPVHLYGQCVDMDPILTIAQKHGLIVIEDACQAHGANYKGRKAGSLGTLGAFSFYFTKNLGAYGEGGMVTTNDPELARRVKMMRDHGSEERYHHEILGWNGRLDELQAAVLKVKLPHLDNWNDLRRANANYYSETLAGLDLITPYEAPNNHHVYHLYVIRSPHRDALRSYLGDRGIGTGIHYPIPIHLQQSYEIFNYELGSLPVTEAVTGEILSLPMYAELTHTQIKQVVEEIHQYLGELVAG